jgi:hypothetical protein
MNNGIPFTASSSPRQQQVSGSPSSFSELERRRASSFGDGKVTGKRILRNTPSLHFDKYGLLNKNLPAKKNKVQNNNMGHDYCLLAFFCLLRFLKKSLFFKIYLLATLS